jgi:hypothetical protein
MYSFFYRLIQKILLKRSFYDDFLNVIKDKNINHIVEIGCADSIILDKLNKNLYYDGFDVENKFIEKSKSKYFNNLNYKFKKQSIHEIDFTNYNINNTIILLVGVFHHVSDEYVEIFTNNTKNFKIYAIDAVRRNDQNFFTKLLMDLDKGQYVRYEDHYKNLLNQYEFILARNKYLNFKYDHLISIKNLNSNEINKTLKF